MITENHSQLLIVGVKLKVRCDFLQEMDTHSEND